MEGGAEEDAEEDSGDEMKDWIVRAVLLFCALVVAGVAVYTTFMLFSAYEIDISLSPPDAARFSPPGNNGSGLGTASFDINQSHETEEGNKTFNNEVIEPFNSNRSLTPNPLIISEELGKGNGRIAFAVVIALEVILVFFVYRKLDKKLVRKSISN